MGVCERATPPQPSPQVRLARLSLTGLDGRVRVASVSMMCVRPAQGSRVPGSPRWPPRGLPAHRPVPRVPCVVGGPLGWGSPGARSAWAVTGCFPAGPDRELRTVRQAMIDFLQNHTDESRPPACPPLDPIRCVARGESRRGRGRCVVPVAASVVGAGGDGRDRAERRLSSSKAQRPSLPHRQPCWPLCGGAV